MHSSNGSLKLYVGDIGDNRKSDLNRIFSKYGEISMIYVDDNKHFAFVEFTSSTNAQRALERTNNKTVNGSRLRVEYAKPERRSRRPLSRENSPVPAFYNHLQVTANYLPSMHSTRQNHYQPRPSTILSRGRSLTPPSFKHSIRVSSMNHFRTEDFYPSYYPHPTAMYTDPAYYQTYGDPYFMQRLLPPPFLPSASLPTSSRAYRNMYSASDLDGHRSLTSHTRSQRSRSPRRSPSLRRNRSSRERKRKRQTTSSISPKPQRERGPQTPPLSHRSQKRSRTDSNAVASSSEQKSSSEDETHQDKQSNSKKSQNDNSNRKHSKAKTRG